MGGVVITEIVSGSQTGADRAALDVAIRHGFPYSGWCPKGRRAEDGVIGGQVQAEGDTQGGLRPPPACDQGVIV